jgi:tRNA threonylcarbamoyladenosine biosynthesis protein TsaE
VIALSDRFEFLCEIENEAGTAKLARTLAETAEPGALLLLSGELGTGKTTLVKHLAAAFGIDPNAVRSPTFTLVHEYRDGRLPLVHMDVYRLEGPDDFEGIGGYEYLDHNEGLIVIEWGETVLDALDPDWLQLRLELVPEGSEVARRVWATSEGPGGTAWLARLRSRLGENLL